MYYGGGHSGDEVTVHCFDPVQDRADRRPFHLFQSNVSAWIRLIVSWYQLEAKRSVTIKKPMRQRWQQTIPSMPKLDGVTSFQPALVVANGATPSTFLSVSSYIMDVVEIFKRDTSQWYRANQLPVGSCDISFVANSNIHYALGGYSQQACLKLSHSVCHVK